VTPILQHDPFATHPHPGLVEGRRVVSYRHDSDAGELVAFEQIFESLPPIAPRLPHHTLVTEVEEIEQHEGHVSTAALALREDRLNPFVAVASTCFTVEHC
jgi:hypothetical protein